ncbi:hypothetical protein J6590_044622 [Homalodisca vitripennis]|nr:hypothetical protein J6590_044622 [Homalodisca vitripennis]
MTRSRRVRALQYVYGAAFVTAKRPRDENEDELGNSHSRLSNLHTSCPKTISVGLIVNTGSLSHGALPLRPLPPFYLF